MERERITISIKKSILDQIDKIIDGVKIRNRSHAFEELVTKSLGGKSKTAIILLGGNNALKAIPATTKYISELSSLGFTNATLALGFLKDKIKERLAKEQLPENVNLNYMESGEGSGGALLQLKRSLKETFIVFNTDKALSVNLTDLLDFHYKHKSIATIATQDLDTLEGIYVFEHEIFSYLPSGFSLLEESTLPALIRDNKAIVFPIINT
jgi:NDP-sugar pyrophosphorylase family protein